MQGYRVDKQLESLGDEQIIKKIIAESNSELFRVIYQRYHSRVFEKCRIMIKDRSISEDITQDIFSKVFEKLNTFRFQASFTTWLYAITYHFCIEYLRRVNNVHYPSWNSNNEIPEKIVEEAADISEIQYVQLLEVLDMIHPEEKALILMKYQENLPIKLIQDILKISESAVKMRLKRAKSRVVYLYNEKFKDQN